MTARFVSESTASRCCAAACSSARMIPILDTVTILAVSICVLCLRILGEIL